MRIKLVLPTLLFLSGCFDGLKPVDVVKHPDSPMLIQAVDGDRIKVSIYDKENNRLIEYGWIEVNQKMMGWTLTKYDWQSFIKKKSQ